MIETAGLGRLPATPISPTGREVLMLCLLIIIYVGSKRTDAAGGFPCTLSKALRLPLDSIVHPLTGGMRHSTQHISSQQRQFGFILNFSR